MNNIEQGEGAVISLISYYNRDKIQMLKETDSKTEVKS